MSAVFSEGAAPSATPSTRVEAWNIRLAVNEALKDFLKRPGIKGRRLKHVKIMAVRAAPGSKNDD